MLEDICSVYLLVQLDAVLVVCALLRIISLIYNLISGYNSVVTTR